jgi:hypothetical protein
MLPSVSEIWASLTEFDRLILGLSKFFLSQPSNKILLTSKVIKSDAFYYAALCSSHKTKRTAIGCIFDS